MKVKIKVKELREGSKFYKIDKGDWIDLRCGEDTFVNGPVASTLHRNLVDGETVRTRDVKFNYYSIPLGIAMQLPKGYEAIISPRSSIYKNYGVIVPNSIGVIDNSYNGDSDEWQLPVLAFNKGTIIKGDRVCQFRIQLSQKATMWQKIKWLFTSKIEFVWVDSLGNKNRGGFGSTGTK